MTWVRCNPKFESARLSALAAVERAGLSDLHEHRHGASEYALPELVSQGVKCQFVYVDGHHGFDHAFLDMFYADALLDIGGLLAFDDSQWRGVHKVIGYLIRHRSYEEVETGLARSYTSRNPLYTLIKRLQGRFGSSRYFRKTGDWKAPFDFYRSF